ncbi:hypothetical protein Tco_1531817 [Tanacetum coccineum]
MADNETKPTTKEFTANDQANYYLGITSIKVNGKNAYELKGKLFDDLHNNAFSGTNGKDAKTGSDETEPINEKFPNLMKEYWNDEDETAKIFKIETNIFDYKSPLCMAFNEFNYLLEVDPQTWDEDGVPYEIGDHICKPFRFKNGRTKWPTCSSNDYGFCNGGELLGMVRVVKDAFRTFCDIDYCFLVRKVKRFSDCSTFANGEITYEEPYANYYSNFLDVMKHEEEERSDVFDDHERPVCNIRRFKMIKYSFRDEEEYVAIKENEYDDFTNTIKEAIHAYQEIFRMMDEG